ncbi:MAG: diaminopimelate epimerase [candidate division WOR-3 bacterium]
MVRTCRRFFKVRFYKFTGSGNDFLIFEYKYLKKIFPKIKSLCDRKFGIGADGVLFYKEEKNYDFRMIYYNSDSSRAEFCANGARCLLFYAFLKTNKKHFRFISDDGEHEGFILNKNGLVRVSLKIKGEAKFDFKIQGIKYKLCFINSGVPHTVIFLKNLDRIDVKRIGEKIRFHEYFKPEGTNVDFVEKEKDNLISIRTYERGVEDEVLACGTGVVASAFLAKEKFKIKDKEILVKTKGGEILKVIFEKDKIFLEGYVRKIFEGKI